MPKATDKPKRHVSRSIIKFPPQHIHASWDAAQTTRHNEKHWLMASAMSASVEASPEIRATLRQRARYEVRNNTYASGMILTKVNDVIGRGPRLQLQTDDRAFNSEGEAVFGAWAESIRLAEKLRMARSEISVSGDSLLVLVTNPRAKHPVALDIVPIEADRLTAPLSRLTDRDNRHYDGIDFDDFGNPTLYHILRNHPGDPAGSFHDFQQVSTEQVIHLFKQERPGLRRGVCEMAPSLPIFSQLRRFTLATLTAAEGAANISAVLQQGDELEMDEDGNVVAYGEFDCVDIERGSMMTLPIGAKLNQFKAEHPNGTYCDFKRELINEAARAYGMPLNIALGNSDRYNYASGRLDFQSYFKGIQIEQHWIGQIVCTPILSAFFREGLRVNGFFTPYFRRKFFELQNARAPISLHSWFFDGTEHVDPQREANAQRTRLESGTTNLSWEYARQGRDYETEMRQRNRELILKDELEIERLLARKKVMEAAGIDASDITSDQKAKALPVNEADEDDEKETLDDEPENAANHGKKK